MTLYIVATPIGNLEDISERARRILRSVPVIFAEDTRHTKLLLDHIKARPRLIAYHHHTTSPKLAELLEVLEAHDAALVSDAGTPGVNDPGGVFVAAALKKFGDGIQIVPIPGPSAMVTAASISGFPMDGFVFFGFPPHKKGRKTFFDNVASCETSAIFYESTHRIDKALAELEARQPERRLVVCRELTKKFETVYRGYAGAIRKALAPEIRGEFVVVLEPVSG